jgi:hypothetical protein
MPCQHSQGGKEESDEEKILHLAFFHMKILCQGERLKILSLISE